ncbi:MAG: hypothetical protein OZSIB_2403 [Candidatus Ozemobacter sibiricus]|uniref:Uncharacterized protein n=1 Tax=Candidatus Ozemobacter sibiricus TaxID=2268124 RepID=A0A367ZSL6_9BACT|nr:MAG: hypothetical protein OZSIB_2403 [Candidatus Ozemobacter sibiricus]
MSARSPHRVGRRFVLVVVAGLVGWVIVGLGTSPPIGGEPAIPYRLDQTAEGVAIVFPEPMAVDRLLVSATHPGVWGMGRAARLGVAKTASQAAVAGWQTEHGDLLVFPLADPWTDRIELIALAALPAPASPSWELRIEGTGARRRRLEHRLAALTTAVAERQTRQGCFCCHQVMPLALANHLARERQLARPLSPLASWALELARWQRPDGSFSFPAAPEFGVVTPTLTAAAVLGWVQDLDPALETALLKAASFLVAQQQPDGSLVPDFTFPPLLNGRPAMGWLFVHALRELAALLERRGFAPMPRFVWAQQRAATWLEENARSGTDQAVFNWLARGEAGPPDEIASFLSTLHPEHDPEWIALLACLASPRELRGRLPASASSPVASPPEPVLKPSGAGRFRQEAWGLVRDLADAP